MTTTQDILEDGGEFFEFAADELLALVIDAFGLTKEAKTIPIRISLSINGAQGVMIGFKINQSDTPSWGDHSSCLKSRTGKAGTSSRKYWASSPWAKSRKRTMVATSWIMTTINLRQLM
jgi:hypothetical protein